MGESVIFVDQIESLVVRENYNRWKADDKMLMQLFLKLQSGEMIFVFQSQYWFRQDTFRKAVMLKSWINNKKSDDSHNEN